MRELLEKIAASSDPRLDAVLHAGAGPCRELEIYQQLDAGRIVLVEANAGLAEQLRKKTRGTKQVQVIASAVAAAEGSAVLRVISNPRESTIMPAERLLERLPNLRMSREEEVPAVPLSQLLGRLAPDAGRRILLVLELQGAEWPVLSAMSMEELRQFSWIAVRACTEPLYEGGGTAAEVDELLRRAGFRAVTPLPARAAPPFVKLLYEIDLARARQDLASELKRHEEASALLEQELADARQAAGHSAKIQALREADLAELQGRYGESLSAQENLRQVLARVSERLKAAAAQSRDKAAGKRRGGV